MRFFDRTEEIASLREIRGMSRDNAQFTVVTGRRRIGKTSLVWKAYEDEPILYFFVARKAEGDLCEDYRLEIENKLGIPIMGRAERFVDMFEFLMKLSMERPITLFIDEFQEFFRVNKSVYSDMQRIWDIYCPKARMNLVVCGSIYSMMTKIFKDKREPLYNRQTRFMTVRPFTPAALKEILAEYHPGHTAEDLLALYSFTGGVAKYVQLLVDAGATTKAAMLDHIIKADSIFLGEGKAILIEEFGKDYGVYFSILSAIARGKTSRSEIESVVGREIGGYLTKLENEYEVIAKKQPLFEKSSTKNIRYTIEDNFFTFWFRFIYKYGYILEIENYESVKTIINRDYETFSGLMLERYFRRVLIERQAYTRIGGWWDRKGENEIDIVAENELNDEATFFEVKRKAGNIDMEALEHKAAAFLRASGEFKGYKISYKGLSMDDM
ncbi:MAG TPA: ATP-binding protein [Candidatus Parabacteroides intestinigallinarum]|uniref:ATP-binding protein n=1 Tax=Candidatus Parabacteroides intestinigallinarum TaxID=2838722 RepID=A0A9D1XQQ4_9BACT|nr:ATP-binding protein [Candidatus Parabacteroides intestinigallinarum]